MPDDVKRALKSKKAMDRPNPNPIAQTEPQSKAIPESLLTVEELSDWLRIDESTIRKKVCYRRIPHVKIGRSVRFRRSEIESWLDEQSTPGPVRYNACRAVDLAEGE
jgi:excisionase family DNA binding protein